MAISSVQGGNWASGSGTLAVTLPVAPTVGNLVLLAVEVDAANLTTFTPTSGAGTFLQIGTTRTINDGSNRSLGLFAMIVGTASNTFGGSCTSTMRGAVAEFSSGTANPLVVDQITSATATSTALNSGNITPSQSASLAVGYGWDVNGGLTVGSGFTLTHAVGSFQLLEYQILSSATPLAATATGTSATWGMFVANFIVSSGVTEGQQGGAFCIGF